MMDWCLIFLVSTIGINIKEKACLVRVTLEEGFCG